MITTQFLRRSCFQTLVFPLLLIVLWSLVYPIRSLLDFTSNRVLSIRAMEGKNVDGISLKAVVDEKRNKVIFVESDDGFVDVLFSFLTMPLGTIIRLAREHSTPLKMGCMINLYGSVMDIDLRHFHFHSEVGKLMFLSPRSEAESHYANLKLKTDKTERKIFRCDDYYCHHEGRRLYSHYKDVFCKCGRPMNEESLLRNNGLLGKHEGVFVNGMEKFLVTDEFRVVRMSSFESFSLLAKHGITDVHNAHERTFNVGADDVLNLLTYSLQSRVPLTEVLMKNDGLRADARSSSLYLSVPTESRKEEELQDQDGKISVKLMISKSKKMVCYAEAEKDFVNFLLSFLRVPLGYIARKLCDADSNSGCIDQLYESVSQLDEQLFKSNSHREMLVSPSLALGFDYKNDLLGIKPASINPGYQFIDPKSHYTAARKIDEGILTGLSTMFIVTDSLTVTPMSSIFCMSILKELKVPYCDIEEYVVHVGKEEAVRLLLSSFVSESALTDAFIRDPSRKPSTR